MAHRPREHAAREVASLEAVLQQDARRVVGALRGAADDLDLAVPGQLAEARAQLPERDVDRARHLLHRELHRLRTSSSSASSWASQCTSGMSPRTTSAATMPAKLTGILGAAELRRVAELRLLEVVDGGLHLDGHRQRADALVHRRAVLAERLRAEHAPVRLAEQQLQPDHLCARVVAGVGVREDVDLLVVGVAEPLERLLARAGPRRRAAEQADDRGALRAAEARIAPGDHVGRDPPLPIGRPGQRHQAPLAGDDILDLDGVADREDVGIARAHLVVDADPAALADLRGRRISPAPYRGARRARG
jgi:hypothetical protein